MADIDYGKVAIGVAGLLTGIAIGNVADYVDARQERLKAEKSYKKLKLKLGKKTTTPTEPSPPPEETPEAE